MLSTLFLGHLHDYVVKFIVILFQDNVDTKGYERSFSEHNF